jgi:Fe2+ transport system protein FeoA
MSLASIKKGKKVKIVSTDAGDGLRGRLAAMGLVSGVEIEVLRNALHGPLLISIKGSRIMLGRGMAQKIIVA